MIGRVEEIEELENLCNEKDSRLAVVYGRRRIGKTYLVDFMFKERRKDCMFFEYTGDYSGDKNIQIKNFCEAVYDWFKKEPQNEISDWTDAFIFLKRVLEDEIKEVSHKGKIVLFFDEIPWVDKNGKNGFLSALGHFWNSYCLKQKNFLMILCGSNASWIKHKILDDEKGPHYKRVDRIISLKPFTLKETKEYLLKEKRVDIDDKMITDIYMIFGGVAKYLSFYDANFSLTQNIDRLFFSIDGLLYGEYEALFYSLFQEKSSFYKKIIDLLLEKKSGFTTVELAKKLSLDASNVKLRKTLENLTQCGFISTMTRFGSDTRNVRYVIADPFCLFYKKWVEPLSKNSIAKLSGYWGKQVEKQSYISWSGFAFEVVCMINIDLYLQKRGLRGAFKNVSYWNYVDKEQSGIQIDLLVEYENNVYDIVECKYYNKEFEISKEYAKNLQNKKDTFKNFALKKKKFDLKLIMLTTYGTKKNNYFNNLFIADDITLEKMLA